MGLFFSEAPPSRLAIEVGLDRCHDLAARASAALSGGGEGGPEGNDGADASPVLVHPTPSTGWTWPAICLGEALTPGREHDPRICDGCGREADRSSSTLMPGVRRYDCDQCPKWWCS